MAEALALSLVQTIGETLVTEGINKALAVKDTIDQLHDQMRHIEQKLRLMQAYLKKANQCNIDDELVAEWVKQFRELAFEIEDLVEEYIYIMKKPLGVFSSRFIRKVKNMKPLKEIADKLRNCFTRLDDLSKDKIIYEIKMTATPAGDGDAAALLVSKELAESAHTTPDDCIFGIEDHKAQLISWLTDQEPERRVISVWGMGGVGKTTLVTRVYHSQKIVSSFLYRAWVSVSQKYNKNDLLRNIIREIHREDKSNIPSNLESMDYRDLTEVLGQLLTNKRYLIIFDDVWTTVVWDDLINVICDNNKKSRVIITTRDQDVGRTADGNHILQLKPLNENSSRAIFNYHAFRKKMSRDCPIFLKDWVEKIVGKCDGLPLALVWIANYLATKDQSEFSWKNAYTMLVSSKEKINTILSLSITNLPHYLRRCFLYCSIFPEDYEIKRKQLLRLWVSEGFIVEEIVGCTKMEVAENYLNQLITRSVFQVIQRNYSGQVKSIRIHDLVRDMIFERQRSECFYEIWDKNVQMGQARENVRYLSIIQLHDIGKDSVKLQDTPHLRSLHYFSNLRYCLPVRNYKLLRVLNLENSEITSLPKEVNILFNLRFLSIKGTEVQELPKDICKLRNLETLNFCGCLFLNKLPVGMSRLNKLQHLMGSIIDCYHTDEIKHLKKLETLKGIVATKKMVVELGSLIQLRTLDVTVRTSEDSKKLVPSIANMKYLVHLNIGTYLADEGELDLDGGDFIELPHGLAKLHLEGVLHNGMLPKCLHSSNNLKYLTLTDSKLEEDPIPIIVASSPNLRYLKLCRCLKEGAVDKICFPVGSFPRLTTLFLSNVDASYIKIKEQSLVCLEKMILWHLTLIKELPFGIEHIANLKHLHLLYMSDELIEKVRRERSSKLQHIPFIKHSYHDDNSFYDQIEIL